jgi:hypothetical protein
MRKGLEKETVFMIVGIGVFLIVLYVILNLLGKVT